MCLSINPMLRPVTSGSPSRQCPLAYSPPYLALRAVLRTGIFLLLVLLWGCSVPKGGADARLTDEKDSRAACEGIFMSQQKCEEAQAAYREFLLTWLGPEQASPYVSNAQDCTNYVEKCAEPSVQAYHHAARACMNLVVSEYPQAHSHIELALKLQPEYLPARLLLAEVLHTEGKPAAALTQIEEVFAAHPYLARLHLRMSMLHMEQQDYARAARDLQSFLHVQPEAETVLLQLGRIQQRQQLWSEAEKTFQTLIDLAPDEPLAYFELGQVLEQQENFTRALSLYRSAAAQLGENRLEFEYLQAQLLLNLKNYAAAADVLQAALTQQDDTPTLSSIWPSIQLLYGYSLLRQGEYVEAVPELRAAAEGLEFNGLAWHWLGEAHEHQEQWYAAMAAFQQIDSEQQEYASALLHLAGLYHVVGYNQDASAALEALLEHGINTPSSPPSSQAGSSTPNPIQRSSIIYQKLGYLYLLQQNTLAAEDALLRGLELYPEDENLAYHLGLLYAVSGDHPAAMRYLEQVVRVQPEHAEALNNLAFIYAQSGKQLERAADMAQRALLLEQRAAYYDTLGWIYFKQERYPAALEQIQQAHLLQPDDVQILEHLGDVHAAMHHPELARAAYLEALHIQPDNNQLRLKLNLESRESAASCQEP